MRAILTAQPRPRTSAQPAFIRVLFRACTIGCVALLLAGCYDADALRTERQTASVERRLEEVDLGAFRIALPHTRGDARDSIVDFHAFGHISEQDVVAVTRALETRMPKLRARMLTTIRGMNDAAFREPKLNALRNSIAQVVNGELESAAVKSIGFYSFTFTTM